LGRLRRVRFTIEQQFVRVISLTVICACATRARVG